MSIPPTLKPFTFTAMRLREMRIGGEASYESDFHTSSSRGRADSRHPGCPVTRQMKSEGSSCKQLPRASLSRVRSTHMSVRGTSSAAEALVHLMKGSGWYVSSLSSRRPNMSIVCGCDCR